MRIEPRATVEAAFDWYRSFRGHHPLECADPVSALVVCDLSQPSMKLPGPYKVAARRTAATGRRIPKR